MTIEQTVYNVLKATSGVTGLVGGATNPRIYAGVAPQGATFPALVLRVVAASPAHALDGYSGVERTVLQVDSYATAYNDAAALSDAVFVALAQNRTEFNGIAQSRRVEFDPETRLHNVSRDFALWA